MTTPTPTLLASEYNRHSFTAEGLRRGQDLANLDFNPSLHVGREAPDLVLTDLEGKTVRLSDFRGKKHVAFEFGCITAPVFVNDITALNSLHEQFRERDVQLLIVYAREAHPGDRYRSHTSLDQKLSHADDLQRLEHVQLPILVDTLEGDAHHTYGLRASPVFVVNKDGLLVYKASWLIADELALVLDRLLALDAPEGHNGVVRHTYSEHWAVLGINPAVQERVFQRSGGGAREEVAQAFGFDVVTHGAPEH